MREGFTIKSVELTEQELEKINTFTRTPFDADRLYAFNLALCNNDVDRDFEKFSLEALQELSQMFLGRTGIKDHSMKSSDQTARIYDTWVERVDGRKTADGEDFYRLMAKAYMVRNDETEGFITEIEAGIKKEVSVSCSMGKSICSVCGKDRRQERCEHIPGKVYNGKTAFVILSDARDAYEFSFVAVPAQREAGVTKTFKFSEKEALNMEEIIKTLKDCTDSVVLTRAQAESAVEYIESLKDEAKLGSEYKKSLTDEVVRLCAVAMPDMDIETFKGVAQVMTAKELLSFKKAFSKTNYERSASLQIKENGNTDNKFNQFKM